MAFDVIFASLFVMSLLLLYIIFPLTIAYYLYNHRFMTDRIRFVFSAALCLNVLFIVFVVIVGLMS